MIADARQAAAPEAVLTLGADKGYDAAEFIQALEELKVVPHVAQNTSGRRSAVADAVAASEGYAISQRKRNLIEQGFGWAKAVGRIRQAMVRGLEKVDQMFVLTWRPTTWCECARWDSCACQPGQGHESGYTRRLDAVLLGERCSFGLTCRISSGRRNRKRSGQR